MRLTVGPAVGLGVGPGINSTLLARVPEPRETVYLPHIPGPLFLPMPLDTLMGLHTQANAANAAHACMYTCMFLHACACDGTTARMTTTSSAVHDVSREVRNAER